MVDIPSGHAAINISDRVLNPTIVAAVDPMLSGGRSGSAQQAVAYRKIL
jgi:hypothetical protein